MRVVAAGIRQTTVQRNKITFCHCLIRTRIGNRSHIGYLDSGSCRPLGYPTIIGMLVVMQDESGGCAGSKLHIDEHVPHGHLPLLEEGVQFGHPGKVSQVLRLNRHEHWLTNRGPVADLILCAQRNLSRCFKGRLHIQTVNNIEDVLIRRFGHAVVFNAVVPMPTDGDVERQGPTSGFAVGVVLHMCGGGGFDCLVVHGVTVKLLCRGTRRVIGQDFVDPVIVRVEGIDRQAGGMSQDVKGLYIGHTLRRQVSIRCLIAQEHDPTRLRSVCNRIHKVLACLSRTDFIGPDIDPV